MFESGQPSVDVQCDLCGCSTRVPGESEQFGVLQAAWGDGSQHAGERYRVRLCEGCFFQALLYIKQEREIQHLFHDVPINTEEFGLVTAGSGLEE
ncbi:hypothetical protein BWR15_15505 [Pseudomonas sp. T]|nr:hypothetical protein BWR15_15505 [Pseudomonas sp. T]